MRRKLKRNLKVLVVLFVMLNASIPLSLFASANDKPEKPEKPDKPEKPPKKPPKGITMSMTLDYLNPDAEFTSISYANIEYWLDGVLLTTENESINTFFNDFESHNLTIYFSGETYEYIFNADISETISLACKSLEVTVEWDEIFAGIPGMSYDLLFNGEVIETVVSDANGLVSIGGLIIGAYILAETGLLTGLAFSIAQDTVMYESDILITPNKTIIDVDYISSITGDTIVDLDTIEWDIRYYIDGVISTNSIWINPSFMTGITNASGVITIYNLLILEGFTYKLEILNYAGETETYFDITIDEFTQVELSGKDLEAEFLWSFDNAPVVGEDYELFFNTTSGWISAGIYTTDALGTITILDSLPIGIYKLDGVEFEVVANDVITTVNVVVGSKSLEAQFNWLDDSPVASGEFDLLWFNGTEFVLYDTYFTDLTGLINITDELQTGTYMFEGQAEFDITMSDTIKVTNYVIVPTLGKRTTTWISFVEARNLSIFLFYYANPILRAVNNWIYAFRFSPLLFLYIWLTARFILF